MRRDLGEILSHGEPEHGMGQGEAAEQPAEQSPGQAFWDGDLTPEQAESAEAAAGDPANRKTAGTQHDDGAVVVDFRGLGPDAA